MIGRDDTDRLKFLCGLAAVRWRGVNDCGYALTLDFKSDCDKPRIEDMRRQIDRLMDEEAREPFRGVL